MEKGRDDCRWGGVHDRAVLREGLAGRCYRHCQLSKCDCSYGRTKNGLSTKLRFLLTKTGLYRSM